MDIVSLPILPAVTSIEQALGILRLAKLSALVTKVRGKTTVIEALDLIDSVESPDSPIRNIVAARATGRIDFDPVEDVPRTELELDRQSSTFAVTAMIGGIASVVTRHERIAAALQGEPRYFVCTGTPRQTYSRMTPDGTCEDGHPLIAAGF